MCFISCDVRCFYRSGNTNNMSHHNLSTIIKFMFLYYHPCDLESQLSHGIRRTPEGAISHRLSPVTTTTDTSTDEDPPFQPTSLISHREPRRKRINLIGPAMTADSKKLESVNRRARVAPSPLGLPLSPDLAPPQGAFQCRARHCQPYA